VAYKTSTSADFSGVGRFSNKVAPSSPYASTGIGCSPAQLIVIDTARAKKRMDMTFLYTKISPPNLYDMMPADLMKDASAW
jgi:hypothetical protein